MWKMISIRYRVCKITDRLQGKSAIRAELQIETCQDAQESHVRDRPQNVNSRIIPRLHGVSLFTSEPFYITVGIDTRIIALLKDFKECVYLVTIPTEIRNNEFNAIYTISS
jgi:hypothetical protein